MSSMKMNTFSGKKFEPMQMTVDDIALIDIAHALSLLCRGGGHIKYFYSVGQHSINCANEAKARGWSKRVQLICLLHDASEAFISDIIRPVKIHLPEYYTIEDHFMKIILEKFGITNLTEEENQMWKQIDDDILDNELTVMMPGEEERKPVQLSSVPDLKEQTYRGIEEKFIKLATELM